MGMEPLFIFMDLEAAHGNVYFGDIIEIAAQVDPRVLKNAIFSRLVNTRQNLSYFVLKVCEISKDMLSTEDRFPEVFNDFLRWIRNVLKKSCDKKKKTYYPVLVAHGGFDNDFMMIQSNMERNEMNTDLLIESNIHFADTFYFLKKARLDGLADCICGSKLSIESLFKRLHPMKKFIGQHRALADVKFMIKIFLMSPLKDIFDKIDVATFESRSEAFYSKHTSTTETKLLSNNLPKDLSKVNHTMTLRRLLRNGVTYSQLQILFRNSISFIDFFDRLNGLGIDRKSAKSIALQLSNMGLSCSGEVIQDSRNEVGDEDCDTDKFIHYEGGDDKKHMLPSSNISRSDSGYESNLSYDDNFSQFYEMFIDEFFYPPDVYEYVFGEFTLKEIEELDRYIADLFDARFPECYEGEVCVELDGNRETYPVQETSSDDILENKVTNCDHYTNLFPESEEKWDDEMSQQCAEFLIPVDHGRLAKVVPIGMTMDDFNGERLSGKVPLFKHFDPADLSARPEGGIPSRSGKSGMRERKRLRRENKKLQRELNYSLINDGSQTVVKSKSTGEVFLLV